MKLPSKITLVALLAFVLVGRRAPAQDSAFAKPAQPISFSVVSVKQNKTINWWVDHLTDDGYTAQGVTLEWLLMKAYGIKPDYRILGAPSWAKENRYDIVAKVDDADIPKLKKLSDDERFAMLQQILKVRFNLQAHIEAKTQPIYSLIVVKPGRLVATPPADDDVEKYPRGHQTRGGRGQLWATGYPISQLVAQLSGYLARMVVDNTGLTGRYDVKLDWTPDDAAMGSNNSQPGTPPVLDTPPLFTAIQQQLGLKLVSTTGPVDCLVVDHVELPSPN